VVQFDKEASQTRDYSVAQSATVRAARPDSLDFARDRLFASQKQLAPDDKSNCITTEFFDSWRNEA